MKKNRYFLFFIVPTVFLLSLTINSLAIEIELFSGEMVKGDVVRKEKDFLILDTGGQEKIIPYENIKKAGQKEELIGILKLDKGPTKISGVLICDDRTIVVQASSIDLRAYDGKKVKLTCFVEDRTLPNGYFQVGDCQVILDIKNIEMVAEE